MRILYFGLPLAAHLLARRGHTFAGVVLGHTDLPGVERVRKVVSKSSDIPMLYRPNLDSFQIVKCLESTRPDVILSWFYPRKLPQEVLALAPRGAFGTHPSLLPRWRGPDPYHWAIRSGDAQTGVTLHRLEAEYDTGNIVDARSIAIEPTWNAWTLAKRLDRLAIALMMECAERLRSGEQLPGAPQDDALATDAPQPSELDYEIDWRQPAEDIARFIRASAPEPGAYTEIGDCMVAVLRARVADFKVPRALQPAEAWKSEQGVTVVCEQGALLLQEVLTEAGQVLRNNEIAALL